MVAQHAERVRYIGQWTMRTPTVTVTDVTTSSMQKSAEPHRSRTCNLTPLSSEFRQCHSFSEHTCVATHLGTVNPLRNQLDPFLLFPP